jgi:hypothetical protein
MNLHALSESPLAHPQRRRFTRLPAHGATPPPPLPAPSLPRHAAGKPSKSSRAKPLSAVTQPHTLALSAVDPATTPTHRPAPWATGRSEPRISRPSAAPACSLPLRLRHRPNLTRHFVAMPISLPSPALSSGRRVIPRHDYRRSSSYIAPCPTANNLQPNPNSATNSPQQWATTGGYP